MASEQLEWKRISEVRIATWNVGTLCVQTDINKCKIANWKDRSKRGQTGRSTLRRRRSALGCGAIEVVVVVVVVVVVEEEEEEEEEEKIP